MNELVGRVFTDGLVSIVVQVKRFIRSNVSQSAEDKPRNPFVDELQCLHILELNSAFLRIVDAGDEDCYMGEPTWCDI